MVKNNFTRALNGLVCGFLCISILSQQSLALGARPISTAASDASQMAEILGVRPQFERLLALNASHDANSDQEVLNLKSQILQKVMLGYLEVRRASDKNWRELSYSYNIMRRAQRKQNLVNQCFTLANFTQLSALYTTEPFLRLDGNFKPSAMCTTTGGGLGLSLPILNILQQKTARVKGTTPPEAMHDIVEAGPVDATGLPPYVDKFLDSVAPGSTETRRQEMFDSWKKRYGVDITKKETLCSLTDEHSKRTIGSLNVRILLLWSLHMYVLDMDNSLLVLINQVKASAINQTFTASDASLVRLGLNASAVDAAKLLNIQGQVARLVSLNKSANPNPNDSVTKQRVEIAVLENVLAGALEVRAAADQVDAETNYASDVVLADLLMRRGKQLQLNYEVNFIQAGTCGSIAGLLYLKGVSKVGNEMFVISGGIGTCLSTLALRLMRGGTRAIDTGPNSLADVFGTPQQGQYRFSPLIATYLNSPSVDSKNGKTRKQELEQYWTDLKAVTVKIDKKQVRDNLAAMPTAQADTIKIVTNRLAMLHRLLVEVESLDTELLSLLRATEPDINASSAQNSLASNSSLTPQAAEVANLIGVQSAVSQLHSSPEGQSTDSASLSRPLFVVRRVFTTALDIRTSIDGLDYEIAYEYDALGRMTRGRDQVIAFTNNINFYQLNILAIIIDGPLGLSGNPRWVRASNMLNIVSGLAVGSLAGLTVLEQHGGSRPIPANTNMLAETLGLSPPAEYLFSPEIWKFINSVPPSSTDGRTRVEQVRGVWKEVKGTYPNVDKESVREKVSVYGPAHTKHSESIKLVKRRLNMLYDVQGLVGLFDNGLDDLLRSV